MAISLFNCWNCEKRIDRDRVKTVTKGRGKNKVTEKVLDDNFFYCDDKCKEEHEKRQEKQFRPVRQWSEYMCGEREKSPKEFAHLVERYGWAKDCKKITIADDGPQKVIEGQSEGRRCGKCGEPGHNARTCNRRDDTLSAPKKQKGKKAKNSRKKAGKVNGKRDYRCGLCDGLGHNARSCDRRPPETGEFDPKPEKLNKSAHSKKPGKYKCGVCEAYGHNARTCKEKKK